MRKFVFVLTAIILGGFLLITPCLAFESKALINHQAPYKTFYPGTFDNLVFDFSLIVTRPDVLKAIAVANLGDATLLQHIKYMSLWQDQGEPGWQGMGVDKFLGYFNSSGGDKYWYISNLSEKIEDHARFFISIDIYTLVPKTGTIKLQLGPLADKNNNSSFDIGDAGIFLDSGKNGPTDLSIINNNSQVISNSLQDNLAPVLVIGNISQGQIINNNNFTIKGWARDQGNNDVKSLAVRINGQPFLVNDYNPSNYQWSYEWQNIEEGPHQISVQAYDSRGNFKQTADIDVIVAWQPVDLQNSSIAVDKNLISNIGLDIVKGSVFLKDENNNPVANYQVKAQYPADSVLLMPKDFSNEQGEVKFEFYSGSLGTKKIQFTVADQVLGSINIAVVEAGLAAANIEYGDLIKAGTGAVYYYGADAKRYVFPNADVYFSWYNDFSGVKRISDQQLASIPIGGNVTFRPGRYMVKITTDPKVYAVDQGGVLKWVSSEDMAAFIYGPQWQKKIKDVPDVFFTDYKAADEITHSEDFVPQKLLESVGSINIDKGLL